MCYRERVRWGSVSGCSSDTTRAPSDSTHPWGTLQCGCSPSAERRYLISPSRTWQQRGRGLEESQRGWHGRVCGGVLSQRWICCICLQAWACLRIRSRQAARTLLSLSLSLHISPSFTVCTSSAGLAGCFLHGFFFFFPWSCPNHLSPAAAGPTKPGRGDPPLPGLADSTEGQPDQLHSAVCLSICLSICLPACLHRHFSDKSNTTHFVLASFSRQIRYLWQREEEVAAEQQQQQQQQLAPC